MVIGDVRVHQLDADDLLKVVEEEALRLLQPCFLFASPPVLSSFVFLVLRGGFKEAMYG